MAKFIDPAPLDYRYGGDKLSNFAQKYMTVVSYIIAGMNELKSPGATAVTEPEAYQWKVEDNHIYMRNGENNAWVKLMDVAPYGGFKTDTIGKVSYGDYEHRPATGNASYDIYLCSNGAVYQWMSDQWNLILSLNIEELNGYEHVLLDNDVATAQGQSGKLLRTNSLGQLETDITGSPGKIAGKTVYAPTISDNQVLVFNYNLNRWEVQDRDDIKWSDTSTIAEADKIVKADQYGKIHFDTTGNAGKLANAAIDVQALTDGDVLMFRALTGTFVARRGAVINANGVVEANVSGSAAKWGGRAIELVSITDGQILVWSESLQAFVNRNQGSVGSAKALVLSQDGVQMTNYNGDVYTTANFVTPHLRVSSQTYYVGNTCFSKNLPYGLYLECTTAGVAQVSEPDYTGVNVGDTVADGSVVWTVRQFTNTAGKIQEAKYLDNIDNTATYAKGDVIFDGTKSPSTCYVCVQATA